ncbi:Hypothetical predicted protein [Cloeon dipterum]|uniref:Uncharacterized protein n=1 Tax=Cloeon dipterum TaxID=197152 RepID=A0A8S1BZF5_9INSE|nr:Hypothetical predicted protein [Cloeon dipterum]
MNGLKISTAVVQTSSGDVEVNNISVDNGELGEALSKKLTNGKFNVKNDFYLKMRKDDAYGNGDQSFETSSLEDWVELDQNEGEGITADYNPFDDYSVEASSCKFVCHPDEQENDKPTKMDGSGSRGGSGHMFLPPSHPVNSAESLICSIRSQSIMFCAS